MSELMLRRGTVADLPAVCALGQFVNGLHHRAWPELFAGPSDPSRDEPHWRASVESPQAALFVAMDGDRLAGFVTVAWSDETNPLVQPIRVARVFTLCVDRAWQRRGIGSALMAEAERWARDAGAFELRLNVWTFNEEALALYRTLGYGERSLQLGKRLDHGA